jgi:hypothetical protein
MKFLAKLNRGAVLSIAVLLAVVIYLIALQLSHNAARPEIESICRNYIKTSVDYTMLPQKYRVDKPSIPQSELDSYIAKMGNDIKAYYPDNEQMYKYVINTFKTSLQNQAKGNGTVFSYTKDVSYFKKLAFDGNSVTVTIVTNSSFDGPANSGTGAARTAVSTQTTDTITLQKTGDKWYVVYANLQKPSTGDSYDKAYATGNTTVTTTG